MVNRSDLVVIGISVGLALGLLLALLLFFAIKWYYGRSHLRRCANEQNSPTLPVHTAKRGVVIPDDRANTESSQPPENGAPTQHQPWWNNHTKDLTVSASGIPRYNYKDIQKATQNFTTVLGQGSFGPVYKAVMPNGELAAAKVHGSNSSQGDREFQTEVSLLGRLHHRNLVNLTGYCVDKSHRMLIYEFMSNGSLENLLYGGEGMQVLNWEERLQIALDISHGIEYLHEGAVPPVIHRDLKSANILLDHSMRAKVADFGLSKEMVLDRMTSGLKGTHGYMDPTYISTNKYTMKSDIYSFGVIILELITAIHPQQNLMEYINLASMSPDGIDEILDQKLVGNASIEEVRLLAKIANRCVHKTPRKRPSIGEVTQFILKIKQSRSRGRRQDTMSSSFGVGYEEDLSRVMSRIKDQHVELGLLAGVKEENHQERNIATT
ncbi:putative calcium/calmodulin-regulated receptor-like kinase 2 RLK-Pelle-LRR-I-2 family [Arabidopsis thaliana]|jgi:serine/threonine protein kinase|uniref:Calcium/calmodulin-regulated receptor-like kinase 2 n=3 Tax=Arabidopsis TaxID=3701 RepID=CRLK2_ARATH|nr:Protein kinase superfamily protein [Arabidopsis thaliana]NP_001331208.1 Protein kinase superfamily protein [Arabidopsis thaliana]Q9LFV3.1 RecName: Full=Calcium/calmodulin-regulated receptor-like kinase 2; Short=AtCRLK2 [Arabidopsis thaliana]KAG7602377.1 Protein kinase domain [Arabidopsis thaliana x Arabidopsis arenosa]AED92199.1 Protein kinase superfamily protein [Arabidopsis thaliana]ANM69538.1 Protein kinase superfamily protein [Arabidopsis thaliana]OAO94387.1 CRLK2 [Arabidopsis thaliana|eukprot:NP_001078591.1 Protein kinase superfamily protein [Arabidopsis thaliana]